MLLVHSTSAISRENIPFQVCISEWVQPTAFIALSQRWGNVERPFLWQVVLCFLCILFSFTFSSPIENEKFYPSSGVSFFLFFLLDPYSWHSFVFASPCLDRSVSYWWWTWTCHRDQTSFHYQERWGRGRTKLSSRLFPFIVHGVWRDQNQVYHRDHSFQRMHLLNA